MRTISAIFDLQVTQIVPNQVSSNWLFGSGEEIPNRFSNGGHGGHLGFQTGMTLVIFFLQVSLIVTAKCLVNWSFVLREYVLNTFSKWRL